MTTLKELAPKLLQVVLEAQEAVSGYACSSTETRYARLECLNDILNEPTLVQAIAEVQESQKPSDNPNEKFWPESGMRRLYFPKVRNRKSGRAVNETKGSNIRSADTDQAF